MMCGLMVLILTCWLCRLSLWWPGGLVSYGGQKSGGLSQKWYRREMLWKM